MIIDVNSPFSGESLNRAEPWTSYHKDYLTRIFGVVENFKNYPNTLAFFAANEVMNDMETGEDNPPYIRVSSMRGLCRIGKLIIYRLFSVI